MQLIGIKIDSLLTFLQYKEGQDGGDSSVCGSCATGLIWVISWILIACTFPFSLCFCIKMVQVCYVGFYLGLLWNVLALIFTLGFDLYTDTFYLTILSFSS